MPIDDMGAFGKWAVVGVWLLGNVVFVIYDFAEGEMVGQYIRTLHPRIKKILRF